MEEAVTNKRRVKYDVQTRQIIAQIGINHLPQIVLMNVRRINDPLGGGVFLTRACSDCADLAASEFTTGLAGDT